MKNLNISRAQKFEAFYLVFAALFTVRARDVSDGAPGIYYESKHLRRRTNPKPRRVISTRLITRIQIGKSGRKKRLKECEILPVEEKIVVESHAGVREWFGVGVVEFPVVN